MGAGPARAARAAFRHPSRLGADARGSRAPARGLWAGLRPGPALDVRGAGSRRSASCASIAGATASTSTSRRPARRPWCRRSVPTPVARLPGMTPITTVLDETEQQLAPLERRYCLAEWDAAVGGDDSAEDRVVEASLALEDVLSDAERFAALEQRRDPGRPDRRTPAHRAARREPGVPAAARARRAHRATRGEPPDAVLQASRRGRGPRGLEQRHRHDPARLDRPGRAPCGLGAPPRRSGRRPPCRCASSHACATRPRAASATATTSRWRWSCRSSTRAGSSGCSTSSRRRSRGHGRRRRPRSTRRSAARLGDPGRRRRCAPGITPTRSSRTPPLVQDDRLEAALAALDPLAASRAYFGALGDPIEEILERSDLYPRDAKHQGAFCIQIDRADDVRILATSSPASAGSRRCCTSSGTGSTTSRSSVTCRGCCAGTRTSSRPRRSRCCTAAPRATRRSCAATAASRASSRTPRSTRRSSAAGCTC